jgi:hypothetical protein
METMLELLKREVENVNYRILLAEIEFERSSRRYYSSPEFQELERLDSILFSLEIVIKKLESEIG